MKRLFHLCILILLTAVLAACGQEAPPTPTTVAELCSMESNTLVEVQGNFSLPSFLTCQGGECRINFGDGQSGIMATVRAGDEPRENMMRLPPDQYSPDDLSLVLDDGTPADRNTTLLATGRVRQPSANDCYLDIHSLRLP